MELISYRILFINACVKLENELYLNVIEIELLLNVATTLQLCSIFFSFGRRENKILVPFG